MKKYLNTIVIYVIILVIFNANTTYCLNMIDGMTEKFINIFTKGLEVVFEPIDQVAIEDSKSIEANVINMGNKNVSLGNINLPHKPSIKVESMPEALKEMAHWYVNHVFTYQGEKAYEDFAIVDRVNGTIGHTMYRLGTGEEKRVEFLKDTTGTDIRYGGNYSYIGQKAGSDTEIIKKENNVKNTYYFKRMTNDPNEFIYDCICYIKASIPACENNHQYVKRSGSNINYYIDCELIKNFEYNDVGDDCTRFAFAVLELGTGKEAKELGNLSKDASQFLGDDDTKNKMSEYFDIYTGNDFIEEYNEGLRNGDMLVAKYGDGESSSLKNKRNHCEFIYNNSLSPIGVFGWGNVKKDINSRARFSIRKNKNTSVEYVYNSEDGTYYSALYRRKGD